MIATTLKAYYDGTVFVPTKPLNIQTGTVFMLSVVPEVKSSMNIEKKLMAFKRLTNDIHEINQTEPLPPEFDEIVSCRVNFKTEINL